MLSQPSRPVTLLQVQGHRPAGVHSRHCCASAAAGRGADQACSHVAAYEELLGVFLEVLGSEDDRTVLSAQEPADGNGTAVSALLRDRVVAPAQNFQILYRSPQHHYNSLGG